MKKLILAALLLASPALASAQDTMTIQRSSCTTNEAGEMICSEPVAITVPARPASTPVWELDNRAIGLVCHQRVGDEATIYCGHQFGNLWGPISINLCRWQEDGSRTCKTTVSEPHNPL